MGAVDFARHRARGAGFDPKPNPQLVATYRTEGEALAVSRGLDRDRVCDESGNQTSSLAGAARDRFRSTT